MNFFLTKHNTMLNTYPTEKFVFHGTGREYFKIWIVNLLLTIATLGIYAAWAKVRTRKYFYQSTELNGNRFDYHGDPKSILKGNLMVAGIALIYIVTSFTSETLAGLILLGLLCLLPMFMVMSLRFHLANSSYRGLRFHFSGTVKKAYLKLGMAILIALGCFILLGIIFGMASGMVRISNISATTGIVLLVGVVLIVAINAFLFAIFTGGLRLFVMNNATFGNAALNCKTTLASFGKAVLKSTLLAAVAFCFLAVAAYLVQKGMSDSVSNFSGTAGDMATPMEEGSSEEQVANVSQLLAQISAFGSIFVLAYFVLFALGAYLKTSIDNLVWNNTTLANQHEFKSAANPFMAAWIHLSNIILIVFTVGLFLPFARIRSVRYRITNMAFLPVGSVDSIVRAGQENQRAFGESAGEALGMEIAL